MQHKLSGKVALVTGAGQGIGRAIAHKLALEGASLVVNDLDAASTELVVNELRALGARAVGCPGSVTLPAVPQKLVQTAQTEFGDIDIIVNQAGYSWDSSIETMTDEQWQAVLDVHLTAPFRILRAAQPFISKLVEAERGRGTSKIRKVINISDSAGLFGSTRQSNLAAAKAGIVGMTKALAKEWGALKVNVNCVAYGDIQAGCQVTSAAESEFCVLESQFGVNVPHHEDQARIPLGRRGTAIDAAGAVYLFCIPESDYISGQTLLCSGGVTY